MFQSSINKKFLFTWLNSQAGKMKRIIMHSDWPPERARWGHLARSGFPALVPQAKVLQFSHIMNHLLTKLVQSIWPNIGLVFILLLLLLFCVFISRDEVKKERKKRTWPRLKTLPEKPVRGRSAGSFPDQRLVIELNVLSSHLGLTLGR